MLCHKEAYRFYDERKIPLAGSNWLRRESLGTDQRHGGYGKISCATLVEVFAKSENELEIPEGVGKEDRVHCRKITMELATCLTKYKK